jgi:hypothetical protein
MSPISIKTKLLSIFVLTFLCLNAGGAVCLAYCQGASAHIEKKDDCPLAKKSADCPHASHGQMPMQSDKAPIAEANSVTCCSLAINVLVAPIERRQMSHDVAVAVTAEPVGVVRRFEFAQIRLPDPVFANTPVLDRRSDRVKHRVFRI